MQRLGHYLAYLAVRSALCVAQSVRIETCHAAASWLAVLFADVLGVRRRLVTENIARAFPEKGEQERRRMARQMWEHLFLFVAETAHAPRKIHETNWRDYVSMRHPEVLVRWLLEERPLVMVSGHYGNFELIGYMCALFGYTFCGVARALDNPLLDDLMYRTRAIKGQQILSKKGEYGQIVETLASGGKIGFIADQYAGSKGCWVKFFGRPASAHKAVALLSMDHAAPLLVGYAVRAGLPLHYELVVEDVCDPLAGGVEAASVQALTQWYTAVLERCIRRAPEQYWWLHGRWKDRRQQRKRARQAA